MPLDGKEIDVDDRELTDDICDLAKSVLTLSKVVYEMIGKPEELEKRISRQETQNIGNMMIGGGN